jgi:hypothetical protein
MPVSRIARFAAYAEAFERAYESDDWSAARRNKPRIRPEVP